MESLKELLTPKAFNELSFIAVIFWILLGVTLLGIFADIENSESRFDFRCEAKLGDKDFTRGKCFDKYEKQYNKFCIPVYGFVIANVSVIAIVCLIYSQCVKSSVDEVIEAQSNTPSSADLEGLIQHGVLAGRRLFLAYCCQLTVRFALRIVFIILQTQVLYPAGFPSNFACNLTEDETNKEVNSSAANFTRTQTYFKCHNQRATKKTFWTVAVAVANGIFAFLVFTEIVYILLRATNGRRCMENSQFYAVHLGPVVQTLDGAVQPLNNRGLKSSPSSVQAEEQLGPQEPRKQRQEHNPEQIPFLHLQGQQDQTEQEQDEAQSQSQVQASIKRMKDKIIKDTEKLIDLKQPFRPNPGEGPKPKDTTIDQIYVNLVIHEGRAYYRFPQDRWEQLQAYPKLTNTSQSQFLRPQNINGDQSKHILVVGRPGIGKTMFSTKLLRMWASADDSSEEERRRERETEKRESPFDIVFLVKFRRFNSDANLMSLRELLARAETIEYLDDEVWDYIIRNPTKLLLIFDGVDEFSAQADISKGNSGYSSNVEDKMPFHCLYNKLASGDLLCGATVITTTRPTAVSCVRHLEFDRIVEILGFTSVKVKEYVENFTAGDHEAKETIWQHINTNINILSLCYIPVNCFIVCHCLLHIINNIFNPAQKLPTKFTEIYSMTVKIFFFKHNRDVEASCFNTDLSSYMFKRFDQLQPENETVFKKLGKIAFRGIEEGRLIFGSSEVEGLEDCGLLHRLPDAKSPSLREPPKPQFCFIHLTLQEFFAAKHLTETMNREQLRQFVSKHIDEGSLQVVLQFVAGLLEPDPDGKVENSDIFASLLPMKTEQREETELIGSIEKDLQPLKLTCWPATLKDKPLAVDVCKCIYEIDVKQHASIRNKLAGISFNAVDFSRCFLAPADCAAVVYVLKNTTRITSMNLEKNNVGSLGCVEIQNLIVNASDESKTNCELNSLNLFQNNITDEGVEHLVKALKHSNCKLKILNLSHNNITDEGAKHLTEAMKHSNCKLNNLNLYENKITDDGAKHLAEALKHSNCKLKSLNLWHNNGRVFTTAAVSLNISEGVLFGDFVKRLKNDTCFHG